MKLVCAPRDHEFCDQSDALEVVLFDRSDRPSRGQIGRKVKAAIIRGKLEAAARAWDFLALALSATAADLAGHRQMSPDGWTREFELEVSTVDPTFWNSQRAVVEQLLGFLTTDIWRVNFIEGGISPVPTGEAVQPAEDCIILLSGGLDSFIGGVDAVASGKRPFAVSQTVRGDAENQRIFAQSIGGLRHLQLNHAARIPYPERPPSQRARSLLFFAYGVLAATTLEHYRAGQAVTLYVCENGFISVNPPLTGARLGSLSTRTTHPRVISLVQQLLDTAGLRVRVENPYRLKTKGEMMRECKNLSLLRAHASHTTSCGRYNHFGYKHCGRCVPCLVRRAAFLTSGIDDVTEYIYADIGRDDEDYAGFDDVRAVAMAVAEAGSVGLENWIGTALSTALVGDVVPLQTMIGRELEELSALFKLYGVR
jgi:7-cyano-7-deazaguanine synthase in queuosine biosynthesis